MSSPLSYSLVHPFIKRLKPRSSVNSSHPSFRLYFPVRGSVEISREEISIEISIVVFLSQKSSQDQFMINEQWSIFDTLLRSFAHPFGTDLLLYRLPSNVPSPRQLSSFLAVSVLLSSCLPFEYQDRHLYRVIIIRGKRKIESNVLNI